jgi:hypothetical protein
MCWQGINTVLADYNVSAQVLGTKGKIGYLIAQIDTGTLQLPLILLFFTQLN